MAAKMALDVKHDYSYEEMTSKYTAIDGIIAIAIYVLLMLIYYFMGVMVIQKQIYLGTPVSLLSIAVCIFVVLIRKQKLNTIGITLKSMKKSLLTGMILGILFSFFNHVLPNILAGAKTITVSQTLYNTYYYFFVISLSEEILFRGYIQTRIHGLIKRETAAIIVTGFMFYTMHLPFQVLVNNKQIRLNDMATIIIVHFALNFLYKKYNSLVAPTILHGFINWSAHLFR